MFPQFPNSHFFAGRAVEVAPVITVNAETTATHKWRSYFLMPTKILWLRNPHYFYFKRKTSNINENELPCALLTPEACTTIYTGHVQSYRWNLRKKR
jgi:hypothetical protein